MTTTGLELNDNEWDALATADHRAIQFMPEYATAITHLVEMGLLRDEPGSQFNDYEPTVAGRAALAARIAPTTSAEASVHDLLAQFVAAGCFVDDPNGCFQCRYCGGCMAMMDDTYHHKPDCFFAAAEAKVKNKDTVSVVVPPPSAGDDAIDAGWPDNTAPGYASGYALGRVSRDAEVAGLNAALNLTEHRLHQLFDDHIEPFEGSIPFLLNAVGKYLAYAGGDGWRLKEAQAEVERLNAFMADKDTMLREVSAERDKYAGEVMAGEEELEIATEKLAKEVEYLKKSNDRMLRKWDKVLKLARRAHGCVPEKGPDTLYDLTLKIWIIARRMKVDYW